jgi:hypothetical protein
MKKIYTFVTLLLVCLLHTVPLVAQDQAFKVSMKRLDTENLFNPAHHLTKLKMLDVPGVKSFCFVETQNSFIALADANVIPEQLSGQVAEYATVQPITVAEYQTLLRKQIAHRLSKERELVKVSTPNFPQYVSTGDVQVDQSKFRESIERWMEAYPQELQQILN